MRPANDGRPASLPGGTRALRTLVIVAAILALLTGAPEVWAHASSASLVMFGLILLSRGAPVALARDKPITFTAAAVLTTALLIDGYTAGCCALAACVIHARLFQRGGRPYALYMGAQYAVAALAAHAVIRALARSGSGPDGLAGREIFVVSIAALAFALANSTLVALGNIGTRYARRGYWEPLLLVQSLAFAISVPFALLIVLAYRQYGLASAPFLTVALLFCAHAVRMTVENRMLARQLSAVHRLGDCSTSGVHADVPLRRFLELARDVISYQRAVVWLHSQETGWLKASVGVPESAPLPDASAAAPDTLIGWAAHRQRPSLIADVRSDPRTPAGSDPESWILYPFYTQGHLLGLAQFVRGASRPFTATDASRLSALVPQVTVAYQSALVRQLMRRYENLAVTDGLTGLLNHRRTQEVLRAEMSRAARYGRPLSVIMLDVDSFKGFNDTYGHPQGDVLLRLLSALLRTNVRSVDHVGRYGGEEFLIILPETTEAEAFYLAERIRQVIEEAGFPTGRDESVVMTVSVGVASFPHDASNAGDLVQRADEAMYRAKRGGKNRVLSA